MDTKNPVKAIRAKCLDCCCGQQNEVKLCPAQNCPLWPFRLGKNPYRAKREMTEEQREAARERMQKLRLAQMSRKINGETGRESSDD